MGLGILALGNKCTPLNSNLKDAKFLSSTKQGQNVENNYKYSHMITWRYFSGFDFLRAFHISRRASSLVRFRLGSIFWIVSKCRLIKMKELTVFTYSVTDQNKYFNKVLK